MKKVKLMMVAVFTALMTIVSFGQSDTLKFSENYLGEDFMNYKGTHFKINENAISGFRHAFYDDLTYCQSLFDNNVIYPKVDHKFVTIKDSLLNNVFRVGDIIGKNGKIFSGNSRYDKPIFILVDTITCDTIYYKYDSKYKHNFPFLTTKIKYNLDEICSKIEREVDDFTNEIRISSPYKYGNTISIYKYIKDGKVYYYLSLNTYGSTVTVNKTGVIILFSDGTKLKKEAKVDVDVDSRGYDYSAFIRLTKTDLTMLSTKTISKFRLYIYDEEVSLNDGEVFMNYVKCVIDKQ